MKKKSPFNIENNLIFIFSDKDSDFHKLILKIRRIHSIKFENLRSKKIMDNSHEKIEIITSRECGYGKSSYVKNKINTKINYFPFGGGLNRKEIVKIIKKRNKLKNKKRKRRKK